MTVYEEKEKKAQVIEHRHFTVNLGQDGHLYIDTHIVIGDDEPLELELTPVEAGWLKEDIGTALKRCQGFQDRARMPFNDGAGEW